MKVVICGGRDFADRELLERALAEFEREHGAISIIIHGDARGADRMAGEWGAAHGKRIIAMPAEWEKLGRKAGPVRNERMLAEHRPDWIIAMPGGRGTAHMAAIAEKAGVPVLRVAQPTEPVGGR